MSAFAEYLWNNKEWIFSGIGVAIVALIARFFMRRSSQEASSASATQNKYDNSNTMVLNLGGQPHKDQGANVTASSDLGAQKARTHILFIDDDTTFAVVKILKHAGWINTKIVKDIRSLDDPDVQRADIFFVDIQGVGRALQFADQGLGLARALKQKYPNKWLVIYSAEPKTDTFHQAFRLADDRIAKTADPYEFQSIVETFAARQT